MEKAVFFYKIEKEKDTFVAYNCDKISDYGYSAKFIRIFTHDYKWDKFEAIFYSDGQVKDIIINGWTFTPQIKGFHRVYPVMSPGAPEFSIKGKDPMNCPFEANVYSFGFFREAAMDYFNRLVLLSKFPRKEIALSFNNLLILDKEKRNHSMIRLAEDLSTYYCEQIKLPNHDPILLRNIKEILNNKIDLYKRILENKKITE